MESSPQKAQTEAFLSFLSLHPLFCAKTQKNQKEEQEKKFTTHE